MNPFSSRRILAFILLLLTSLMVGALEDGFVWNFDRDLPGEGIPFPFAAGEMNSTNVSWKIVPTNRALSRPHVFAFVPIAELTEETESSHGVVFWRNVEFADGITGVSFRFPEGTNASCGILLAPSREETNVTLRVGWDSQQNVLSIEKIQENQTNNEVIFLQEKILKLNTWHRLQVIALPEKISLFLNGSETGEISRKFWPFHSRFGFWARGAETIWFDDINVDVLSYERQPSGEETKPAD